MDFIVRLFEPLLRLLFPPTGRHRAVAARLTAVCACRCRDMQAQRRRRRALWLAVHGVDVGPRLIHGVEVVR